MNSLLVHIDLNCIRSPSTNAVIDAELEVRATALVNTTRFNETQLYDGKIYTGYSIRGENALVCREVLFFLGMIAVGDSLNV